MEGEVCISKQRYLTNFLAVKRTNYRRLFDEFNLMRFFYDSFDHGSEVARPFKFFDLIRLTENLPIDERYRILELVKRRGAETLLDVVEIGLGKRVIDLALELHTRSKQHLDRLGSYGFDLDDMKTDFIDEFNNYVLLRINDQNLRERINFYFSPILFELQNALEEREKEAKLSFIHGDLVPQNITLNPQIDKISFIDPRGGYGLGEEDTARFIVTEEKSRGMRNELLCYASSRSDMIILLLTSFKQLSSLIGSNLRYGDNERIQKHTSSMEELIEDFGRKLEVRLRDNLLYSQYYFQQLTT